MKREDKQSHIYCPLSECGGNYNNVCSATEMTGIMPVGMPNVNTMENLYLDPWNAELTAYPVRPYSSPLSWSSWEECPYARKFTYRD